VKTSEGPLILLGLGANLGDPIRQLASAIAALSRELDVITVSSVYRTEPVGLHQQPEFYNMVLLATGVCTVFAVHLAAEEVERSMGRVRTVRNGPRTIDVDLLTYGELALESDSLTVPHPRMHLRSFVLGPVAEIAPEWRHPILGATAGELSDLLPERSAIVNLGVLRDSKE
jgi:2-amino-4-hydroxy-6-hydroxymethyldihydropteridine diphosphokinase